MRELKSQLVSALLVILTLGAFIAAGINLQQQDRFRIAEDGVTWLDRAGPGNRMRVEAVYVAPRGPGAKSDIRVGDELRRINTTVVERAEDVVQILVRLGAWSKAEYGIVRGGVETKRTLVIAERAPDTVIYYQYLVGAVYLFIGLFVYFRRGNAPKATHFYVLCLASFVLSCFHYTGKLNAFDKVIYWGNVLAGLLAPSIFLHFSLTFNENRPRWRRGWRMAWVYAPAAFLILVFFGVASGYLRSNLTLIEMRLLLDRVWLLFISLAYLGGTLVLHREYTRAEDAITRNQLKWLRNGALFGTLPFTLVYTLPYALGVVPGDTMKLAVFSLILIPLTWAYAVLRYRLMDVDVIFQQGYVYTLATLCVIGVFYGLVLALGDMEHLSPAALVILILIATFIFQPIRAWLQEVLDRYVFYRDRYDYRLTLIEFARELASDTDLDRMLRTVSDRLLRTLSIQHIAVFVAEEHHGGFRLHQTLGRPSWLELGNAPLDLSFLNRTRPGQDPPYLFFERTRHHLDVVSRDWPASVRETIARLDLTYYVPCTVRGRTIAYLGLSRTVKGDFLSSDDLELLQALSGSVGIAIENALLYASLQNKVAEYERLKEFSENIVESIAVGILAADLDDRVESWNSQMERLTGIARDDAVGRRLSDLFPADLCQRFGRARGETGILHLDKIPFRVSGNGNGATRDGIVNLAIAPLVARDAQQIGRLIIFDDVTDRTELERRLIQADKLSSIGLLAAGVAHEVNTPLAVISNYAQMLAKQVSGDDTKARLLEKIAKQTVRASEIVNSLLSFSRTSTRDFDDVDLNRVIRETISLIGHQMQKAHIQVRLELEEDLASLRGNPNKLQQVFLNLFLNARDAMERGGTLTVRTYSDEGRVRVDVIDSGQGIPPENLSRIFDPFFTTKAARKGTGLGLSVTYGIVQEHGGHIEVESRPGVGTRFQLDFPAQRKLAHAG